MSGSFGLLLDYLHPPSKGLLFNYLSELVLKEKTDHARGGFHTALHLLGGLKKERGCWVHIVSRESVFPPS